MFLLYLYGYPRDLHSFPTRRSSDLVRRGADRQFRLADVADGVRTADAADHSAVAGGVDSASDRDRKSTRLNSSHGYISYAVFCLKKKMFRSISLFCSFMSSNKSMHS